MNQVNELYGPSFEPIKYPKKLVFLLHGYGDNGNNFINLAQNLYDSSVKINFFAPSASSNIPQYPDGRQWFNLYPNGIYFKEAGPTEKEIMKKDYLKSVKELDQYITKCCLNYNLSYQDCFILGFSQGAMIAFEFCSYLNKAFAGCIMLSGRILSSENDKSFFVKTPLLIIHGDKDEVVPPYHFKEACNILNTGGFLYESHLIKDEGHLVSSEILQLVKNFIKKNV